MKDNVIEVVDGLNFASDKQIYLTSNMKKDWRIFYTDLNIYV